MKKLLSLLGALVLAGSSAGAVVSCSTVTVDAQMIQSPLNGNDNTQQNDSNKTPGWSGNSNTDGNSDKSSSSTDSSSTSNGHSNTSTTWSGQTENSSLNKENIQDALKGFVQKIVLQDQYGFNSSYLDQQIFGDNNKTNTTIGNIDKNVAIDGGANPTQSINSFASNYLNSNYQSTNINSSGSYGSSSLNSSQNNPYPILDLISDQKTKSTIISVINSLKGINFPNPTQLVTMIRDIVPFASVASKTILGYEETIRPIADQILSPEVYSIISKLLTSGSSLEEFQNLTVAQTQSVIFSGISYVLAILQNDKPNIDKYSKMSDPSISTDAISYVSNFVVGLIQNKITIDVNNIKNFIFGTNGKINVDNLSSFAKVVFDTVQLLSLNLEAYDDYKVDSPTDSNHIFSKTLTNYQVVQGDGKDNKGVRNTQLKDMNTRFNLASLVSNLKYYLGDLDKPVGLYRLQALFSIFFMDDVDRGQGDIILSWNNSGTYTYPGGWFSSDKTKTVDNWNATSVEGKIKTPISQVIDNILKSLVENKNLPNIPSIPFTSDALKNINEQDAATHNVYMIIQDIVWNKGFKFSTSASTGYEYGMQWIFNFLPKDMWNNLMSDGFLKFLYQDDLQKFLNDVKSNLSLINTLLKIIGPLLGVKVDINGYIDKAQEALTFLQTPDGKVNIMGAASWPIKHFLENFNVWLFNRNKYMLNPTFASYFTGKSIPQLISLLANYVGINGMENSQQLEADGIDLTQFKPLIDLIFGQNGNNIIDQFFDALKAGNFFTVQQKLNDLLGIGTTDQYYQDKPLGMLLKYFTPGLITRGNIIYGDASKSSPMWNLAINVVMNAWNDINIPTNYDSQLQSIYSYNNAFSWSDMVWNPVGTDGVIKMTTSLNYDYQFKDQYNGTTYERKDTYEITISKNSTDSKFTVQIQKVVKQ